MLEAYPVTSTAQASLQYAELALGYDLTRLRKAIAMLIHSERQAPATEIIEPDPVAVMAFCLTISPSLVHEWQKILLSAVKRYGRGQGSTFSFVDHRHRGVQVEVRSMVVEAVLPGRK